MKWCFCILFCISIFVVELNAVPQYPGTIIAESIDPFAMKMGSPSITVLPDGKYLASHDWEGDVLKGTYTSVYVSNDKGDSWELLSTVEGICMASIFYLHDKLYLMGVSSRFSDIIIRVSNDFGISWSNAINSQTGLLYKGKFSTAPVPVVIHDGRIWRSYEESPDEQDNRDFHSFVISAPVYSDLLDASNWRKSSSVRFNPLWINASNPEWLEGNVVVTPENEIVNILRLNSEEETNGKFDLECPTDGFERYNIAAKINVTSNGSVSEFDPYNDFIGIPGALSKFTIRFDPLSDKYWTIVNKVTKTDYKFLGESNSPKNQKNVLTLYYSYDLYTWFESYTIARWREGEMITRRETIGFQYPDWQFDGDDIAAVVQTSWFGDDLNNSNLISFYKIKDFRIINQKESPPDLKLLTESKKSILEWSFNKKDINGDEVNAPSSFTQNRLNVSFLSRGEGLKNNSKYPLSFSATTHLASAENSSKTKAIEDEQYFAFSVQAEEGYTVSLSSIDISLSRNADGPSSYRWQYSFDNLNFTEISSGDYLDFYDFSGEGERQPTVRLDHYSELQNIPYTKEVFFRIYFWQSVSSSGRISIGKAGKGIPSLIVGGSVDRVKEKPTPIISWDFDNLKGITMGNVTATACNEGIQLPSLYRGTGLVPVSLSNGYYSYFSSTINGNNLKSHALQNDDYYAFQIQAKENKLVELSEIRFKLRRNKNGPIAYRWSYRVNNDRLIELGESDMTFLNSDDFGAFQKPIILTEEPLLKELSHGDVVEFRLYAWGGTSSKSGLAIGRSFEENSLEVYGSITDLTSVKNEQDNEQDYLRVYSTNHKLLAEYMSDLAGEAYYEIRDLTGRLQHRDQHYIQVGRNILELPNQLTKGIYVLIIYDSKIHYSKFIKK